MELFRITRAEYKNDLTGIGAYHHGGRWNSPRNAVLYTSSRRSLAMLEILVHWQKTTPPPNYVVVVLFIPDTEVTTYNINPVANWQEEKQWSRNTGDNWLKEKKTLLMRVPSVVVPTEFNYLINPAHPGSDFVKVVYMEPFQFDARFFSR